MNDRDGLKVVEFRAMFPGRCMICSHADFARMNGTDLKPVEHSCPEGRGEGPAVPLPSARTAKTARHFRRWSITTLVAVAWSVACALLADRLRRRR